MSVDLQDLFDRAGPGPVGPAGWDPDTVVARGRSRRRRRHLLTGTGTVLAAVLLATAAVWLGSARSPADRTPAHPAPVAGALRATDHYIRGDAAHGRALVVVLLQDVGGQPVRLAAVDSSATGVTVRATFVTAADAQAALVGPVDSAFLALDRAPVITLEPGRSAAVLLSVAPDGCGVPAAAPADTVDVVYDTGTSAARFRLPAQWGAGPAWLSAAAASACGSLTAPGTGRIAFCVGVSAGHPTGSTVTVTFLRGTAVLGAPMIQVPMRVSIDTTPGRFAVVVDSRVQLTGTVTPGGLDSGSVGSGCPAATP